MFQPFVSGKLRGARPPDSRYVQVRLCRQSLRYLQFLCSLTKEEDCEPQPVMIDSAIQADAADVGYRGTLESNLGSSTPC